MYEEKCLGVFFSDPHHFINQLYGLIYTVVQCTAWARLCRRLSWLET